MVNGSEDENNVQLQMIVIITMRLTNSGMREYYLESGDDFQLKTKWKPLEDFQSEEIQQCFQDRIEKTKYGMQNNIDLDTDIATGESTHHQCEVCGKCFTTPLFLQQHSLIHSLLQVKETVTPQPSSLKPQSPKPRESRDSKRARREHSVTVEPHISDESIDVDDDNLFQCSVCHVTLSCAYNVRRHMLQHRANLPHQCHHCEQSFSNRRKLAVHRAATHTGEKLFQCRICGVRVVSRKSLTYHMQQHTKSYPCGQCGERFPSRREMLQHKETSHLDDPFYHCAHCEEKFSTRPLLVGHKRRLHSTTTAERCGLHECDLCGKSFHKKYLLVRHRVLHQDRRVPSFSCAICQKQFRYDSILQRHIKRNCSDEND